MLIKQGPKYWALIKKYSGCRKGLHKDSLRAQRMKDLETSAASGTFPPPVSDPFPVAAPSPVAAPAPAASPIPPNVGEYALYLIVSYFD